MIRSSNDVCKYVNSFLESLFEEQISIEVHGNFYIFNHKLKVESYRFWQKNDIFLLRDFKDMTFEGDWIGTIFFFLSGYWEYTHGEIKDKYGRFPVHESFAFKKGVLEEPVVDILVSKIAKQMKLSYKSFYGYPKVAYTHDIDFLSMYDKSIFPRNLLGDVLKRKKISMAFNKIIKKINNIDPYDPEHLLEIHRKYNTKGIFFLMADRQPKQYGGGYSHGKEKNKLIKLGKAICSEACDIGIHYDVRYLVENRMVEDIKILNNTFSNEINIGRAHYLMFDIKKSYDIIEKSGIMVDTTGAYAGAIGFKFGTSYLFKPYNFMEHREYNFYEMPLIVMDTTLQAENYMNLTAPEGYGKIKELMDKIQKYNGIFSLLWHNSSFYTDEWKDWEWVFSKTIEYGLEKSFICVNSCEFKELQPF